MHAFIRGFVLLSLGLSSFSACSGSTTGGGESGPVPESDLPARYAQALCPNMAACCQKNGFTHDPATCQASIEAQARALLLAQQGLATTYDAAAMGQCLDGFARLLQGCGTVDRSATDICERVFVGTLKEGAACKKGQECIDPPNGSAYCQNGVCAKDSSVTPVHAVSGAACGGTCTSEGSSGSYSCTGTLSTDTDPARCFTNDGLRCDTTTKRCVPASKIGEPCTFGEGCAPGAYCDGQTCVAQKTSGPCSAQQTCASTAYCDYAPVTTPPTSGASECRLKKADGEACTSNEQCVIDNCSTGKCGPHLPVSVSLCAGLLND